MAAAPPLEHAIVVHRMDGEALGQVAVGDELSNAGYTSTTLLAAKASKYAGKQPMGNRKTKQPTILHITLPAGTRTAYLPPLRNHEHQEPRWSRGPWDEQEMLLPRGTRMRVDRIEEQESPRRTRLHMTLVDTPKPRRTHA